MNLSSKKTAGKTTTTPMTTCNQLRAALRQLEHFIFQTGRTVPQFGQDQITFGNLNSLLSNPKVRLLSSAQRAFSSPLSAYQLPHRPWLIEANTFD